MPKFPENVDFWTVRFLTVFSSTEKNEKKPKKEANLRVLEQNDGPRRARRRGKERQALQARPGFSLEFDTPAPLSGYGEFKRSAHSAVPTLVAWMLGGLEDWGGILLNNQSKYLMGEPWGLPR